MAAQLAERIIGQPDSLEAIVPYVQMYQANLAPEGRPAKEAMTTYIGLLRAINHGDPSTGITPAAEAIMGKQDPLSDGRCLSARG